MECRRTLHVSGCYLRAVKSLNTRLLALPVLVFLTACLCGAPCCNVGEQKCEEDAALRCVTGGGWSLTSFWSRTDCHAGETCQMVGDGAFCGAEPFEECPEHGETRCVDGQLQECSGPLGPDTPQFWRARDGACE